MMPAAIKRRADANTFPLDEHAVETTYPGPRTPVRMRTISTVAYRACCRSIA
jgi:hypothetical protein